MEGSQHWATNQMYGKAGTDKLTGDGKVITGITIVARRNFRTKFTV